ncbi:unnamed protein product [Musa textilis]
MCPLFSSSNGKVFSFSSRVNLLSQRYHKEKSIILSNHCWFLSQDLLVRKCVMQHLVCVFLNKENKNILNLFFSCSTTISVCSQLLSSSQFNRSTHELQGVARWFMSIVMSKDLRVLRRKNCCLSL